MADNMLRHFCVISSLTLSFWKFNWRMVVMHLSLETLLLFYLFHYYFPHVVWFYYVLLLICVCYFCCSSLYFRVQIKVYKPSLVSAWCIQHALFFAKQPARILTKSSPIDILLNTFTRQIIKYNILSFQERWLKDDADATQILTRL